MRLLPPVCLFALTAAAMAEPVAYDLLDGNRIDAPLGGLVGDAGRGAALAAAPTPGCLGCHDGGKAGSLDAAAALFAPGELRLSLVALSVRAPEERAHDFYEPFDVGEAAEEMVGRTVLSAQDIEDLMAWIQGLSR